MKSGGAAAGGDPLPAFDPTFGAADESKPADAGGDAASKLMRELIAYGAVPENLSGQAEVRLW